MPIPAALQTLAIPAIAAPMFLTSGPDLVVEVSRAGLLGSFPALNCRTTEGLRDWLDEIGGRLAPGTSYGVNLILHKSNPRLQADLAVVVDHKVPLVITSLGAVPEVVDAVHGYGGLVFHDVVNRRHAEKAAAAGVDGIIAVSAGAGGHAGVVNPFALLAEIRQVFDGTLVLAGSISNGAQIAAARIAGADMAYLGTRFIATREAMADPAYKQMLVDSGAGDILYTANISGVPANFLRPSLVAQGLDPDNLPAHGGMDMASEAKAWKTIWSAGHGTTAIADVPPAAELCARLIAEYREAIAQAAADPFR